MPITLVGSSRELKNRCVLPPIDLLDLLGDRRGPGGDGAMVERRSPRENGLPLRQVQRQAVPAALQPGSLIVPRNCTGLRYVL